MTNDTLTVNGLIDRMLAIMEDGKGWTVAALARDDRGYMCDPASHQAATFCIQGAALRALGLSAPGMGDWARAFRAQPVWVELERRLRKRIFPMPGPVQSLGLWNNRVSDYDVIRAELEACRDPEESVSALDEVAEEVLV